MIANHAIPLAYQLIAKLHLKPSESLIKLLACISTNSSTNAFPIKWLSEKSSWSTKGLKLKQQEDDWLDKVKESILRTSTSAFFHRPSI